MNMYLEKQRKKEGSKRRRCEAFTSFNLHERAHVVDEIRLF